MKRVVEKRLAGWYESKRRKPLMIRGARQVGKTWLVEHFAKARFEDWVKVDLEKRRDLHDLFGENLDPRGLLNGLELAIGRRIEAGRTLLFLDEIQACPRAITALRYFYEEIPDLHIIAAGSLLEFAFAEISIPVGRIQYVHMYPMTFYEYLLAIGKEIMADTVLAEPVSLSRTAHDQILNELRTYFFVGGMPECVKTWRDTTSLTETGERQAEIVESFRDDFSKYTPHTDFSCLDAVLLSVARSVGEQLKYTRLNGKHGCATNHKAFDLLLKARVIQKIESCNPSGLPLGATANPKKFKAAVLDIGLMQRLCGLALTPEVINSDLLAIYRGRLAEQYVAQEMLASGAEGVYYWARDARNSSAEVDFLAIRNGRIVPVEVKAGAAGSLRSLHLMLNLYPDCSEGLVLSTRPFSRLPEQKLTFLPLYYAGAINKRS